MLWIGAAHFIIHIMNYTGNEWLNAEIGACACVYVCVWGWGVWGTEEKKREILCHHSARGLFFLECPPVAFVTSSFHVTTRHLLLKFLNIFWNLPASSFICSGLAPSRWPQPLGSASWKKPKKHRSSSFLLAFVHQPPSPSSCSTVLHSEWVRHTETSSTDP